MDEGKSEDSVPTTETQNVPDPVPTETAPVEEPKGLSIRDALEVAHEAAKVNKPSSGANEPSTRELQQSTTGGTESPNVLGRDKPESQQQPALDPPAEWSKDEKEAFKESSRRQQEAALRLHNSRQKSVSDIRSRQERLQYLEDLEKSVTPFIKALGTKEAPHIAIQKATQMWHDLENAKDPRVKAAEYLQAKGIEVPEGLLTGNETQNELDKKLTAIQSELESVKSRQAQEDRTRAEQFFGSVWQNFSSTKNAAGQPKFPDAGDTPEGMKLAGNIGSLINNETALSKQFIASAQSRIPNLTWEKLYEEAYKFSGGKVDDSPAPRTTSQKQHIAISRRAAASVPGSGGAGQHSAPKKLTMREALESAVALQRENEGA